MALLFAMILYELATNAVKYGAFSNSDGFVSLSWGIEENGNQARLQLLWREAAGPRVQEPQRRGFGMRLMDRGVAVEMKGTAEVTFHPDGLQCAIAIPLPVGGS